MTELIRSEASILVIDVGGNNVKLLVSGEDERRKVRSGPELTPERMVPGVLEATADWSFDVISIGVPGPVQDGKLVEDPVNLGPGWVGFDFEGAFGKPVRLMNDAAMQALGSYPGEGRMLFLGLGTGLGNAVVEDWKVMPMELGHLPYRRGRTFEEYVGKRGLERLGEKKWRESVLDVIERLSDALQADYVVLGGGNSKRLAELPSGVLRGDNANAFKGGFRMWDRPDIQRTDLTRGHREPSVPADVA